MSGEVSPSQRWEAYKRNRRSDPRTTQELIELALAEEDEEKQKDFVEVLQYRGTYEVLEAARSLCKDPDPEKRVIGAWILGQNMVAEKTFHDEAVETLLDLLKHEKSPEVLCEVAFSLGSRGDMRAVEPLAKLKNHPHEDVRYGVVHGLFGQAHPLAIATLIDLTTDEDSDVRDWATFELGSILEDVDTPELREALVARLTDNDGDTQAEALVGLAKRKDERALQPLIDLLEELDADSGNILYEAAAEFGDSRLCPVLSKIKGRVTNDRYLDEALETCGCNPK